MTSLQSNPSSDPDSRLALEAQQHPDSFQALYDQVRSQRLGHLAGGVHRDGASFATVYYGVERRG